ncbi:MAG TPA: tRNA cytidylyltransferase [Anaeromyxobacter sp.]
MRVPAALTRARFPEPVLDVLRRLDAAGHRSWLVGGAVRDLLLHRPRDAADFDVATPAMPDEVTRLFRRVVPTGIEHGTVTVVTRHGNVEVTTFRGEGAYVDGRRPGSVVFHRDLEADLSRRDFTMNALAFDPIAPEFKDPFGGREDMRRRIVRAVGPASERFGEDGLRPMRAVRFAAQLGYDLHPATRAAIPGALDVVRKVSVERIAEELLRLVVADGAARGVELLRRTGLLGVVVPELAALPAAEVRHAASLLSRLPADPALRLAALLHALGPARAGEVLFALRVSRRISDEAAALVAAHACPRGRADAPPSGGAGIRRWLSRVTPARVPAVLALREAEARALPPPAARRALAALRRFRREVEKVRAAAPPLAIGDLALDGRGVMEVLGTGPGPRVGEALRHLLDRVLEDPSLNAPGALESELRAWWLARGRPL